MQEEYKMWKSYYKAISIIDSLNEIPVIEQYLLNALEKYKIRIDVEQYETIKLNKTDMVVKKHIFLIV